MNGNTPTVPIRQASIAWGFVKGTGDTAAAIEQRLEIIVLQIGPDSPIRGLALQCLAEATALANHAADVHEAWMH